MARISRTPIDFTQSRINGNQVGEFDPNSGRISVQRGGQSVRQIARTIAHEDIHALLEQMQADPNLNEEVTHNIVQGGTKEKSALERLRRQGFNTEQVQRAVRAFKAAEQLAR